LLRDRRSNVVIEPSGGSQVCLLLAVKGRCGVLVLHIRKVVVIVAAFHEDLVVVVASTTSVTATILSLVSDLWRL